MNETCFVCGDEVRMDAECREGCPGAAWRRSFLDDLKAHVDFQEKAVRAFWKALGVDDPVRKDADVEIGKPLAEPILIPPDEETS